MDSRETTCWIQIHSFCSAKMMYLSGNHPYLPLATKGQIPQGLSFVAYF